MKMPPRVSQKRTRRSPALGKPVGRMELRTKKIDDARERAGLSAAPLAAIATSAAAAAPAVTATTAAVAPATAAVTATAAAITTAATAAAGRPSLTRPCLVHGQRPAFPRLATEFRARL